MKQIDLIFLPFFGLALLVLIFTVWAVRKFKHLTDENKSEVPGRMEHDGLSEEEMGVQYSEFPTFDVY